MRYLSIAFLILSLTSPVFARSRHRVVHVERPCYSVHKEAYRCRGGNCGQTPKVVAPAPAPQPVPIAPEAAP